MTRDTASMPGWYGKIASLGDFASRRLTPDWIDSCDAWLSRSMTASRSKLGERWLETYLSAPVWRFAWAPGVVDRRWWFGVLMPSCDNVGRYFPLIIVQPRDRPPLDRIGLDHLDLWWSQLATAAMETLQEDVAMPDLESRLAELPPWPAVRTTAGAAPAVLGERVRVSAQPGAGLVDLAGAWAANEIVTRLSGSSLWWPMVDTGVAPAVTVAQGLPDPTRFDDLLTGRW